MFVILALLLASSVKVLAQWQTNGNLLTGGEYIGGNGSSTAGLDLQTNTAYPIRFYTNGSLEMTLLSGGNLGIGTSTPAYLLDVSGGDINLSTGQGLRINGTTVLSNTGTGNMFVGGGVAATGSYNAFFGHQAGNSNVTDGIYNTFIGYRAGKSNTRGDYNTFVGMEAGSASDTAVHNTMVGYYAGKNNTSGAHNSFFGSLAGEETTTGIANAFFGAKAGQENTTGFRNTYLGENAGRQGKVGTHNTTIGTSSGYILNDHYNTFVGVNSGFNLDTGQLNVLVGNNAGRDLGISPGSNNRNVILGAEAGYSGTMAVGTSLTLVGYNAEASNSLTNAGAIGAYAKVDTSNCLVLGSISGTNGASANANVGIGITKPVQRLHVQGTARITGSVGTATTIMGRNTSGDVSAIIVGSGLNLSGNTLTATGGGGGDTTSLGNYCSETQNLVSENYEIPLDSANFYFTGQENWVENIGMGMPCDSPLLAKLHVYQEKWSQVHPFADPNNSIAGMFIDNAPDNSYWGQAVVGTSLGSAEWNFGGFFQAAYAEDYNIGVYASGGGSGAINYGGFFNGDVYTTGAYLPSDGNLKTKVEPLADGLSIIRQLRPKEYEYLIAEHGHMELPEGIQYGFIAQEFAEVLPTLTKDSRQPAIEKDGQSHPAVDFKALNYIGLIPFLTKAIQEQQAIIEAQEARLLALESEVGSIRERLGK